MNWVMRMVGKSKKKRAGFTLVELMIVIIIVGVLAAAAVPIYTAYVRKARTSEAKATIGSIRSAEEVYFAEHGVFLPLSESVEEGSFAITTNKLTILGCDIFHNTWWKGAGVTFTVETVDPFKVITTIEATATAPSEIAGITVTLFVTGDTVGEITYDAGDWLVEGT